MRTLIVDSPNYYDRVECENFSELRDTILVNFYDANSIPIPADDDKMFEDMAMRGYSLYITPNN